MNDEPDFFERIAGSVYYASPCRQIIGLSPVFKTPVFCPNTAYGAAFSKCKEHR